MLIPWRVIVPTFVEQPIIFAILATPSRLNGGLYLTGKLPRGTALEMLSIFDGVFRAGCLTSFSTPASKKLRLMKHDILSDIFTEFGIALPFSEAEWIPRVYTSF